MASQPLSPAYVQLLGRAVRDPAAWSYTTRQMTSSLQRLRIEHDCIWDVIGLLEKFDNPKNEELDTAKLLDDFQATWRKHLDRAYFIGYESLRFPYLKEHVLDITHPNGQLGTSLDVGCGRGCVSSELLKSGFASTVLGVDQAHFESEWRERRSEIAKAGLQFARVPVAGFGTWLAAQTEFDTVIMSYVLHHSNDYWAARTLLDIQRAMSTGSQLIILEDSYFSTKPPMNDPYALFPVWNALVAGAKAYLSTSAYHSQALLDFVAVQLLANFREVDMPCNYKTGEDWIAFFEALKFKILRAEFIGFPNHRDIDVPQSFFVLGT